MRPFDPRLLRTAPAARRPVAVLAVVGVLQGVATIGLAASVAALVVAVVEGTSLRTPALWLAALFAVRAVLAWTSERVAAWVGVEVTVALRGRLVDRWLAAPAERRPAPDRAVTLAAQGAASVEPYAARFLPALVAGAVVPVLAIATLFWVDWLSGLIVLLTLPLLPFFAALIGRTTQAETEKRWSALASLSGHFLDVMRGLPTLVGYGRAERQVEVIGEVSQQHRVATMSTLRLAFMSSAALELLASISVAIVAVTVGPAAHPRLDDPAGRAARHPAGPRGLLADPPGRRRVPRRRRRRRGDRRHPRRARRRAARRRPSTAQEVGVALTDVAYTYPERHEPGARRRPPRCRSRPHRRDRTLRGRQVDPPRARGRTAHAHRRYRARRSRPPRHPAPVPARRHAARRPRAGQRRRRPGPLGRPAPRRPRGLRRRAAPGARDPARRRRVRPVGRAARAGRPGPGDAVHRAGAARRRADRPPRRRGRPRWCTRCSPASPSDAPSWWSPTAPSSSSSPTATSCSPATARRWSREHPPHGPAAPDPPDDPRRAAGRRGDGIRHRAHRHVGLAHRARERGAGHPHPDGRDRRRAHLRHRPARSSATSSGSCRTTPRSTTSPCGAPPSTPRSCRSPRPGSGGGRGRACSPGSSTTSPTSSRRRCG